MFRKVVFLCLALLLTACQGSRLFHLGPTPTPFPEKLEGNFQVGSYKLHIVCEGDGEPTIILENGLDGLSWDLLSTTRFKKITRTCRYLRVGMYDEKIDGPRTTMDQVKDLNSLLTQSGVPGPYILVGHSIAGFNMTLYTQTYPKEVVGLVCVDCRSPSFGKMLADKFGPVSATESQGFQQYRGDERWIYTESLLTQEHLDIGASEEQVLKVTNLGDRPFIVLVSSQVADYGDERANQIHSDTWKEADKFYLNLSSRSRMEVVPLTDHLSILSNQAVDKAVQEVYNKVTGK